MEKRRKKYRLTEDGKIAIMMITVFIIGLIIDILCNLYLMKL